MPFPGKNAFFKQNADRFSENLRPKPKKKNRGSSEQRLYCFDVQLKSHKKRLK